MDDTPVAQSPTVQPATNSACPAWIQAIRNLPDSAACGLAYAGLDSDQARKAELGRWDLWYLGVVLCGRKDLTRSAWLYQRVREVERDPDSRLDLWARGHYKSTIITYLLTIQEILRDPELTIGIFSHTRPAAKAFLRQIQRELEDNKVLHALYPDCLYSDPRNQSPQWSLDGGLVCKRKSNPKEATIEASGLVDGQPTGKHYRLMVYDDVVTLESVSSPEMMSKTTDAWALSLNLGAGEITRVRYVGTRYHATDTYREVISRGAAIPRIHAATVDGTTDGAPVFLSPDELQRQRRRMGGYVFSCQMLLNPLADSVQGFRDEWLSFWDNPPDTNGWNIYITVDPAGEKKRTSDYTVFIVHGLAPDGNYYVLDMVRDRLNLTERAERLFSLVMRWRPIKVGYEKYGLQADTEYLRKLQSDRNFRFPIVELGGSMPKNDRIRRLIPHYERFGVVLPRRLIYVDRERRAIDLTVSYLDDEFRQFPVSTHDDMLDAHSRIFDETLAATFPIGVQLDAQGRVTSSAQVKSTTTSGYKVLGR